MEINLSEKKKSLRRECLARRRTISQANRAAWDGHIAEQVLTLPEISRAARVFCYVSMADEVSTRKIITHLLAETKQVFVPSEDHKLLHRDGVFELVTGAQQESLQRRAAIEVDAIAETLDVVIVPGIAWDRDGFRVGFGGGYFDRLLADLRPDARTVGLAYDLQIVEGGVPRDPWDQAVDVLVTETSVIVPGVSE